MTQIQNVLELDKYRLESMVILQDLMKSLKQQEDDDDRKIKEIKERPDNRKAAQTLFENSDNSKQERKDPSDQYDDERFQGMAILLNNIAAIYMHQKELERGRNVIEQAYNMVKSPLISAKV